MQGAWLFGPIDSTSCLMAKGDCPSYRHPLLELLAEEQVSIV